MGVVYKALDTKLDREVALKFLPSNMLGGDDIRKRFEREAKASAALSHPNVCHVYEIDEAEGRTFIAMALIEGQPLDQKIGRGPLKLDEVLAIAQQIAAGLEAAHEKGIVHRDIKPQNVMVDSKGHVTIMDFGLAQLVEVSRLTREGTTIGTVSYMSPEQTEGSGTDHRTDIWSLGVVIYEMLTGLLPFRGDYEKAVMYSILNEDPEPITALRTGVPMELEVAVNKALAKSQGARYQSVVEMVVDLNALQTKRAGGRQRESSATPDTPIPPPTTQSLNWKQLAPWVAAAVMGLAFTLVAIVHFAEPAQPEREIQRAAIRTVVELPDSAQLSIGSATGTIGFDHTAVAISPNGLHLTYVGRAETGTRLYYKDLTSFEDPRPLLGTEGALHAFFSPDSAELGFLTGDRVKKVTFGADAVTTLCRASTPIYASWIDETVYFGDNTGIVLSSVSAAGGEPTVILDVADKLGARGLRVLPGARAALAEIPSVSSSSSEYNQIWVVSLDGDDSKALPISGFAPRYIASGHLLFMRGGTLFAAPFDIDGLEVTGEAVAVLEGVVRDSIFGLTHVAVSDNGTIAYIPGNDLALGRIGWVDRRGNGGFLDVDERVYGVFDLAPDDLRFALQVADARDFVWIWSAGSRFDQPGKRWMAGLEPRRDRARRNISAAGRSRRGSRDPRSPGRSPQAVAFSTR